MYANGKALDLLYRQTAPEIILEILKRNLRGEPEDFLLPVDQNGDPNAFLEIPNQPVADKRHFLDYAETTLPGNSEDEHWLLYKQLRQRRSWWEEKGIDEAAGFLMPMIEFAMEHLTMIGSEPFCRQGRALDWREAYLRLGQDLLVNAYLAWEDHRNGVERSDFTWPVILRVENQDLYEMLGKGLAENHNHLAGGTQSFQVTWCRMMNYPEVIREELINFRTSNLYSKMHRGEKIERLDKFDGLELAALIRTILFRALHREEFTGLYPQVTSGVEKDSSFPFDGRTAFAREYVGFFSMCNGLTDTVNCLRNAYGVRIQVLDDTDYCLDYAMEDRYLRAGKNQNIRLVIGERSFLYRCMRACLKKNTFTDFEKELFYLYMVLQCNFRSEMIQNNEQTGFLNFKNYQDRKDDAWDQTPYYSDAMCMALNNRLHTEQITALEGRMVPKPEKEKNIGKVLRSDLAKRFADCSPEGSIDRSNYAFNPDLDADQFRGAPWFYVFHYFKAPDDRKLELGQFTLPQCRHAAHRKRVLDQTRGFVEALRESPYFRSRVRGIDAASDEVFCRPEIFAVAYRYIDRVQKKWNASDDGLLPASPIRISKTYHAGEDFLDIAGGLRAIDEAIRFLHMGPHSRIGHALALGVEPGIHYQTKHHEIITTKQERLDDLVWILYRGKELGVGLDSAMEAQLRQEADQLLREIYGKALSDQNWSSNLSTYWLSTQLRGDDPSVYSTGCYETPGMSADEINTCLIDTQNSALEQYRKDLQITGLYYYYQFGIQEGLKGAETYIKRVSQDYIRLMRRLQDAMIGEIYRRNLIIETNPSSNVLIGTFKDYCLHPVFRFNDRKLLQSAEFRQAGGQIQLNVCVNTDDLGVFDTTLEFEYALLYEALQKRREYIWSAGTDAVHLLADNYQTGNLLKGNHVGSPDSQQPPCAGTGAFEGKVAVVIHQNSGAGYSDHNILEYLDDLRKIGLRAVFAPNAI